MTDGWWKRFKGSVLAQGDLLPNCRTPIFVDDLKAGDVLDVEGVEARLIVVTQSCDLENEKVDFVAFCPVHTLGEFAEANPKYKNAKEWNEVRKGRVPGLHLLTSPDNPHDNMDCFVVDFGNIVSLPLQYVKKHAEGLGDRWRLEPPYLEHFSQAFARFFMRVGLPSGIEIFK